MARLAIFTERYTIRPSVELTALTEFRLAAFERGHELDFLFKNELKYLKNYDGILIRALTDPLNTTYLVARTAEMLGKRVLDHSDAILVCCDKVNMYARLAAKGVSLPETRFLEESELTAVRAARLFEELGAPLVLKAPNSSFSAYVDKVTTPDAFIKVGKRFLRRADRIVVQQYIPSEFDWRVITLAGKVLAVLAMVALACGLLGLEEKQQPEAVVSIDAHTLPFTLPLHHHQALEMLRDSDALRRVLGDRFVDAFIEVKTLEWRLYNKVISSWEREYLLLVFDRPESALP